MKIIPAVSAALLNLAFSSSTAVAACGSKYFEYDSAYCKMFGMPEPEVDGGFDFEVRLEAESGDCNKMYPSALSINGETGIGAPWVPLSLSSREGEKAHYSASVGTITPLSIKLVFTIYPNSGRFYYYVGDELHASGYCTS